MDTKYNNIVVAVDGSKDADKAFKKSLDIVKRNNAKLILTHVVNARTYATIAEYEKVIINDAKEQGQEILNDYENKARDAGVTDIKVLMKVGVPKSVLTKEVIPEENADLIMVGATGLNAVERFLIGSVSENIVRHATCDVLIVR